MRKKKTHLQSDKLADLFYDKTLCGRTVSDARRIILDFIDIEDPCKKCLKKDKIMNDPLRALKIHKFKRTIWTNKNTVCGKVISIDQITSIHKNITCKRCLHVLGAMAK